MNSKKPGAWRLFSATLGVLAAGVFGATPAQAVVPVVKTVPWVATHPQIPHSTYPGRAIRLKGTSSQQGANFQYSWDFGDGAAPAVGVVSDMNAIEASHTYVGPAGQVWSARLTVTDLSTGQAASRTYYVEMKAKSLEVEANVAIDEGLWYLHKTQFRSPGVCSDCSNWQQGGAASLGYHGVTAANLNAFMVNGHQVAGSADNPYTDTVTRGMRFLFTQLSVRGIGVQADGVNGGTYNPDVNGNGLSIYNAQNEGYQTGMLLSTIVASGTPNALAPSGPANVIGRKYIDIAQDIVDNISYCQYDSPFGGGWYYTCNGYNDNSISQWMAIGILGARSFGALLPQNAGTLKPNVVPEWNKVWLRSSQVAPNPPNYDNGAGYFGYQGGSHVWGPYAVTASGMVQLVMDGIGRGSSPVGGPSWEGAETFMRENWGNDLIYPGNPYYSIKDYYYGLFSFTKAMLLHDPDGDGVPNPITCLRSFKHDTDKRPSDWYGAELGKIDGCNGLLATSNGVARTLILDQDAAGYWSGHNFDGQQYPFETAWAIMMLNRTVFESGVPVAVAKAIPNPAVVGQTVTLDGADSFHQDGARSIKSWQWDFNNDGVWDATGPVVTRSFPALGSYPVVLRVTDDANPEKSATTTVMVQVSIPPLAPTANANGPYNFCPATPKWFLDGTGSVNPDQGQSEPGRPGDTIQSYAWDLNGSGQFNGASGPQPDVKAFFQGLGVGNYVVQLKVTDTTASSFPSSGMGNLSGVASAAVNVRDAGDAACAACIANLAARAKPGKIQLTWSHVAGVDSYNVYRSTLSGGPYSLIGKTSSNYATWLDSTVVNGTTYHYVVRRVAANSDELCQSNQASATAANR
ncbi:PKD domain-containing protein [Roseateles oligotrophus]|uniref:PKD domain-containing protein n=1 Tax=Roseateles oligotrophus TaxID=1769250 RepID=A0ABT2YMN7_9BURK|nr:PKD domain-containing protein [Roseateles oligotrophus]MCV2371321.1 PKD domain-containing protein [Roseateles oligotrophus]